MDAIKKELANGKESVSAEAKRLFAEINFGLLKKSDFVREMLEGVVAPANEVHDLVKHLEAVWRGKAAPTMAELQRAKAIVEPIIKTAPVRKSDKSLEKMGIISSYEPKYATTQALKGKMDSTKKRTES